jgi:hypothetical protein
MNVEPDLSPEISDPDAPQPRLWPRLLAASGAYFGVVFAMGLLLGPIRVIWLEPWLGATLAVACEMPFLLAAMGWAARNAPKWAGLRRGVLARLGMGLLALIMQQGADLSVGFGLRGMNLQAQLDYFSTPAGWIYAAALVLFVFMPVFALWSSKR